MSRLRKFFALDAEGDIVEIPGVYGSIQEADIAFSDAGRDAIWLVDWEGLQGWHKQISDLVLPVDESLHEPEDGGADQD